MKNFDRQALRQEARSERIDALWDRLDQELVLPSPRSRWHRSLPLVAAAVLGFSVGGLAMHAARMTAPTPPPPAIALNQAEAPDIYAAGDRATRFRLRNGSIVALASRSVVEHRAGEQSLVLLRGEITLLPLAANKLASPLKAAALTLRLGELHIVTRGAELKLQRLSQHAELAVSSGYVEVRRRGQNASGDAPRRITPGQRHRIALYAQTPPTLAAAAGRELQPASAMPTVRGRSNPKQRAQGPSAPAWVSACDRGDYQQAYEMVQSLPGGAQAVIPTLRSAKQLLCISSGGQLKQDHEVAKIAAKRVVKEHEGDVNAMVAASDLERIHTAQGNLDEAAKYRRLKERLSKDTLLTANGLCNKIKDKAKKGENSAVVTYAARYRQQYPGGACTQHIEQLVDRAQRATADEDPYIEQEESASKSKAAKPGAAKPGAAKPEGSPSAARPKR
jgi:hypothetical protein